jgi:chromate transporter
LIPHTEQHKRVQELARLFLKLGTIAFGGPAAHIAMMEEEVVKRRQWLTSQQLLDLIGATNLIPGPNSTELAIHIGYERAGWRGLIVAGACFILPAMLIVWALAAIYVRSQALPQVDWLLYGIKPVIIAIVAQALWRLGQSAVKNVQTAIAGAAVILLFVAGWHALLLLLIAGLAVMLVDNRQRLSLGRSPLSLVLPIPTFLALGLMTTSATPAAPVTLMKLFWFFVKIGSVLYGSGYVLLAFLQADLVERWQWLTSNQLLDAIAIGQFTPGPVFTTATFIGYLLAGHAGAVLATLGIFLPSFVFVAAVNPWVPKLRRSHWAGSFLDGVNVASMGLMAVVTWKLALAALVDWVSVGVALLSVIAAFRLQINSAWLVLGGGVVGVLARLLG